MRLVEVNGGEKPVTRKSWADLSDMSSNGQAVKKELTTLKGIPEKMAYLDVRQNFLTSLKFAPKIVDKTVDLSYNKKLSSLVGAPESVGLHFIALQCGFKTLEGCPREVTADFVVSQNTQLHTLEGGPVKVGGSYNCAATGIKTLEFIAREINTINAPNYKKIVLDISWCPNIDSLKNIHKRFKLLNGSVKLTPKYIRSHVLGLFLVPGIHSVVTDAGVVETAWWTIFQKHWKANGPTKLAMYDCQTELLEKHLGAYAQL